MNALFDNQAQEEQKVKSKKAIGVNEKLLMPILAADKLLFAAKHQQLLSEIVTRVDAPDQHYKLLYKQLIDNFAEFVQLLPVTNTGRLSGILSEGLHRACYALEIQQQGQAKPNPLYNYVLFSAALLFDVAKVNDNRTIMISQRNGSLIKVWQPYEASMLHQGPYYKIRLGGGIPSWLGRKLTPTLAVKLMPEFGFKWIADNSQALNIWLALLGDERASAGGHRIVLNRAQERVQEFVTTKEYLEAFNFEDADIDVVEAKETKAGEDFLEWLKDGLDDGDIPINDPDAHVHVVDDGLFIETPEIYKDFQQSSKADYSVEEIKEQVEKLGYSSKEKQYASKQTAQRTEATAKQLAKVSLLKSAATATDTAKAAAKQQVDVTKAGSWFKGERLTSVDQAQSTTSQYVTQGSVQIKNGSVVPAEIMATLLNNAQEISVDTNIEATSSKPATGYPEISAVVAQVVTTTASSSAF